MKRVAVLILTILTLAVCAERAVSALSDSKADAVVNPLEEQTPVWVRIHAYTPQAAAGLAHLQLDVTSSGLSDGLHVLASEAQLRAVTSLGYTYDKLDEELLAGFDQWGHRDGRDFYDGYRTYAEAVVEMQQLVADHPDIFVLWDIGDTHEGRDIWVVKVSDNPATDEENEGEIFIHGNTHAREIMTLEIPMYILNELADAYGTDPDITYLINHREVFILPTLNPDGHVYVEGHTSGDPGHWWRKNRSPQQYGATGVDLNRNYGYQWGYDDSGSSGWPWDITYRGTEPFSELETTAVHDFFIDHPDIEFAMSYHSYGEYLLVPWGYINAPTPDNTHFLQQANAMNQVVYDNHYDDPPRQYNIGRCGQLLYPVNGDFTDWSYGGDSFSGGSFPGGVFGYTFEVNTLSEGGFGPDASYIEPTCELHYAVFLWMLENGVDTSAAQIADLQVRAVDEGVRITFNDCGCESGVYWVQRREGDAWRDLHTQALDIDTVNAYLDLNVQPETAYTYRVRTVSDSGEEAVFGPVELLTPPAGALQAELLQPFPNPLTPGASAAVVFRLPVAGAVSLAVYDTAGRRVDTLAAGSHAAGRHSLSWDSTGVAPGVYLLRLETNGESLTRRVLIRN